MRAYLLLAVTVAALLLVLFGPLFLDRFSINVLTRSMIYAILTITVDLLWGFTGLLTFGQAAFFGVGAYASAMVLVHLGTSLEMTVLAFALAILVPLALGIVVGWLSFYYGSTPLYATVISLVVPIVVTQLIYSGGTLTGSSSGLIVYSEIPLGLAGYFRLTGLCLLGAAILAFMLVRSETGRLLVAIKDNETRLAYLGLNIQKIKIVLTAGLAVLAGLAGFLYANASGVVAPEITGFVFGTELVVWTALGGRGTILGPIVGTLGIDYLSASLSGNLPFLWKLIVGTLFVVMIIFLPRGLASFFVRKRVATGPAVSLVPIEGAVRQPARGEQPLLSVRGLGKSYGSLAVLQGIDLDVQPGELVSLVGPNGAGKTTMMRCLSDGKDPWTGSIEIAGQSIHGLTPNRIVGLGLGRKFQVASVFDSLSVGDCLRIARMQKKPPRITGMARQLELPASAIDILRLTGLDEMLAQPVSLLSHGQKQSLELAMVVALEPRLILLDEPTAGLTKTERTTIGDILKKLTGELGYAAILVEHDLDFVREISSRVVVLHQGKLLMDATVEEVVDSELVKSIYSGGGHD